MQLVELSGLDDIMAEKEHYKQIIKNIEPVTALIRSADNKAAEYHFVSLIFMLDSVVQVRDQLQKWSENEYCGCFTKRDLQQSVFDYLSRLDSAVDYLDKLYKELKKAKKYSRRADASASVLNDLRNEVLHEKLAYIVTRTDRMDTICCQMPRVPVKTSIELQFGDGKRFSLYGLLCATYEPTLKNVRELLNGLVEEGL